MSPHQHRHHSLVVDPRFGIVGVNAHKEPTPSAGCHRHVAVDENRQTAEHPLLAEALLTSYEIADTAGKYLA